MLSFIQLKLIIIDSIVKQLVLEEEKHLTPHSQEGLAYCPFQGISSKVYDQALVALKIELTS